MTRKRSERESSAAVARRRAQRRQYAGAAWGFAAIVASFGAGSALQTALRARHGSVSSLRFADRAAYAHGDQLASEDGAPGSGNGNGGGHADGEDGPAPAATFESVYSLVKEHYVDTLPSDHEMSVGTLRSLLAALNDPNATFLDAEAHAVFRNEAKGHYAGIGARLYVQTLNADGYTDHKIVVVSTLPGSPAEKAGLRTHDAITHVDGRWILGSDPFLKVNRIVQKLQDANKESDTDEVQRESDVARRRESGGIGLFKAQMLLRGDAAIARANKLPTESVQLTVVRPGVAAPLQLTLTPAATSIAPISERPLSGGEVLLKIPAFTDRTADEIAAALQSGESGAAAHGFALDLRGNAGGVGDGSSALQAAARVAALFLPANREAPVFAFEQGAGGAHKALPAIGHPKIDGKTVEPTTARLVVLVDSGTAGAAEALAAALTASGRATLCGGKTFGDATVQTLYPLPDNESAFTLVTGRLLTPNRVSWAGVGLTPKVAIAPGATEEQIMGKITALLQQTPAAAVAANSLRSAKASAH